MNSFLELPAPAGNGAGAWVDTSQLGGTRTITVTTDQAYVTIEFSNQTAAADGFTVTPTFQASGEKTVSVAALWMRAVVSNFKTGGAPVVNVGAADQATSSLQLVAPAGDGNGTGVDTSMLPNLVTVQVTGGFSGTVNVEVSEDAGATYETAFSFSAAGGKTMEIVADHMRVNRTGVGLGVTPQVWVGATTPSGGGSSGLMPVPFPVPPIRVDVFARLTGSDTQGTGTLANPYRTLPRACLDLPLIGQAGYVYTVDCSGLLGDTLPDDFTLPAWKGPGTITFKGGAPTADQYFEFEGPFNITAIPMLAPLSPAGDAIINVGDVASVTHDAVTSLTTVNLNVARASWGANAVRGKNVVGPAGGGGLRNAVVYESTTTLIRISTTVALTFPFQLMQPSASFDGAGVNFGSFNVLNVDCITVNGLKITSNDATADLYQDGNGCIVVQMCDLQSPNITGIASQSNENRISRSFIHDGTPFIGANVIMVQGLMLTCAGGASFAVSPTQVQIRQMVFDGCDPIEPQAVLGGGAVVPASVAQLSIQNTLIRNGIGAGVIMHSGQGLFSNVAFGGNVGDGVTMDLGKGFLQLAACGGTGVVNGGIGVNVQDGCVCQADAATTGNAAPILGTGGQTKVGNLATQTWATFAGAPNRFDITAVAAGGATGTGSRLYT